MKNFEDLTDGSDRLAVGNLRDAILKLEDKYGETSTPILKEISDLLSRYEVSLAFELYKNNEKKKKTYVISSGEVDQHTKNSARKVLGSFMKRHPLPELSEKFNDSPLARDLAKRNDLWKTILITEKVYLQNITSLNDNYCKPIAMKQRSNKILNEQQIRKIFQNFEDIKLVTQKLWKSLEAADKTAREPMIGKTFLENIKDIQCQYVPYIRGFSQALKQLIKIRNRNSELVYSQAKVEIVDSIGSKEILLPVASFLMLPLVRVQEYLMMIKELTLLTPPDHPDNACIQNVKDEFVKIGIELSLAKTEKLQKIGEVLSTLKGDIPASEYRILFLENLYKQLPAFIREGPINIITDKKKKDCYMFLFSTVMVIAEIGPTGEKHFDSYYFLKYIEVSVPRPRTTTQVHHSFYISYNKERRVCLGGTTEAEILALNCDLRLLTAHNVDILTQHGPNAPEVQIEPSTFANILNQRTTGEDSVSPRRSKKSDRFTLSLQVQKEKTEEDLLEQLPDIKVVRLSKTKENGILKGPDAEDARAPKVNELAAARSISTLPVISGTISRRNRYSLVSWKNRLAVVVSDGQGQGSMTRVAEIAATTVIENLKGVDCQLGIIDVRSAGRELLRSFALAHEIILKSSNIVYDSGSTSLLAGLLMETEPDKILKSPRPPKKRRTGWIFLTLSVGDCKAYHWSHQQRAVKDITKDTTEDGYQRGGRLGPQIFRDCPDLRNIEYNYCNCYEDDLFFVVTNGVYDNFDPENLGLSPRDAAILKQQSSMTNALDLPLKWSDMDPTQRKSLKTRFATDLFTKVLVESSEDPLTARTAVTRIIDYCIQITQPTREYVENNPHKKPPKDRSQFLGVLDHTTCVCFEVKRSVPLLNSIVQKL